MSRLRPIGLFVLLSGLFVGLAGPGTAAPADIAFDREARRLSVDVDGEPLLDVLGQLAARTGWHIFVEPGSNPEVKTRFENESIGRSIELLVGRMNYALVPQRDGPTKLFVFSESLHQATLPVPIGEKPPVIRRIGNELIVSVTPDTDIEALARRLGAKVTGRLAGTNTYRLSFEDDAAADAARETLAEEEGVESVDSNYVVDRPDSPQSVAQGPQPPVKLSLNPPPSDGGIVVGLVDTGVQSLGDGLDQFLLPGKSVTGSTRLPANEITHGTSMAQTILRSIEQSSEGATSIRILPVDIYGSNPSTSSFDVAAGIAAAINGGANIINLSSGSYEGAPYLQDVITEAARLGIVIFAAAGNEPVTDPVFPAAYPEAVAVTAYERNQIAAYANRGAFVDMAAPGSSVVYFNGQPLVVSGTSTATAYASGLAGSIAEARGLTPMEAAAAISQQYSVRPPTQP